MEYGGLRVLDLAALRSSVTALRRCALSSGAYARGKVRQLRGSAGVRDRGAEDRWRRGCSAWVPAPPPVLPVGLGTPAVLVVAAVVAQREAEGAICVRRPAWSWGCRQQRRGFFHQCGVLFGSFSSSAHRLAHMADALALLCVAAVILAHDVGHAAH